MKTIILSLFILSPLVMAQHNNRSARDLQFRFGNPGARSLGFGGAFLGLADDATAPVANPAGMARTAKISLSLEVQYESRSETIPFGGGSITQTNLFEFDFDFNPQTASHNQFRVPYAAVVIPKGRWRWSVFVHQQADLKRAYTTDRIEVDLLSPTSSIDSYAPSSDLLQLDMTNYGVSIGSEIGSHLAWGCSLFYSDMSYRSNSTIHLTDQIGTQIPVAQLAHGDDQDVGGFLGLLWTVNEAFSVGATYKRQGEFDYQASLEATRPNEDNPNFSRSARFRVPDSFGLGLSVRPSDRTTFNADFNRVYYSQITDNLVDFANVPEVRQSMTDVTEIHIGFELAFINAQNPWFLRLGYWLDPYHAAVNDIEDSQILRGSSVDPGIRDIFFLHQFAEDTDHYSLGWGMTMGQHIQIDLAIETSDVGEIGTLSGIYRF
ncbi:MAG: outer membrane protein transport protein [Acidobacteria bacterium]|nr:outer membrane protein transport protein [Acidobacteriota bacterium]